VVELLVGTSVEDDDVDVSDDEVATDVVDTRGSDVFDASPSQPATARAMSRMAHVCLAFIA
jgi:hypothetical protein